MYDEAWFQPHTLPSGSVQHLVLDGLLIATQEPLDDLAWDPTSAELERTPGPTAMPCSNATTVHPSLRASRACNSSLDRMVHANSLHAPSVYSRRSKKCGPRLLCQYK
jgi:hypothetical protein